MAGAKRQTLAEQLREAITRSGITLYKLSQESGIDRSQLSRFMRGERDMSLLVTDKLTQVLGLQFCENPGGNEAPKAPPATPPAADLQAEAKDKKPSSKKRKK
jgi:transcriptional regulator with XRE-family HTH domain